MGVEAVSQLTIVPLNHKPSCHAGFVEDNFGLNAQIAHTAKMTFNSLYTLVFIMFDLKTNAKR
jgi:hypothetical protein